jgi:hypothetical protein
MTGGFSPRAVFGPAVGTSRGTTGAAGVSDGASDIADLAEADGGVIVIDRA